MKITIDKENISLVFETEKEKEEFIVSDTMRDLMAWKSGKIGKHPWEKFVDEHPEIFDKKISPVIKDPPLDVSPRIDDPPYFPSITTPNVTPYSDPEWTMQSDRTVVHNGGAYVDSYGDGADATPKYGKATVDFPSKYPCDATPESFKRYARKSRRSKK